MPDKSKEERIRAWREQRRARSQRKEPHADLLPQIKAKIGALALRSRTTPQEILQIALDALQAVAADNARERRAIYDCMREGLAEANLSESAADFWARRTQNVVRSLEIDIRKGTIDVFAPGYSPDGLAETDAQLRKAQRLLTQRKNAQDRRGNVQQEEDAPEPLPLPGVSSHRQGTKSREREPASQLSPQELADKELLAAMLLQIRASQRECEPGPVPLIFTVWPLLKLRVSLVQADSRIALLWSFLLPMTMVIIMSAMYIITGVRFVLGMDVETFSLLGMVNWYMFRIIIFRSSEAYFGGRPFLNMEPVTPLMMALVNSVFYFIVYVVLLSILISVGHAFDILSAPDNVPGVAAYMFGIAVIAASLGLLFGSIASYWHFFLRLAPPIERFLQLFSSVFFVSEQIPAPYRHFILWWPMSHGLQLLRSCYFPQYESHDANPYYFIGSVVVFFVIGLLADRLAKSNVHPM